MKTALTRRPGPELVDCQLTFVNRQCIDVQQAIRQHKQYEATLIELGIDLISLPNQPSMPDAVFVEDTAVVLDEIAVIGIMGTTSRKKESKSVIEVIEKFRPCRYLTAPATLEGGDVIQVGRTLYVGLSSRTNQEGVSQLRNVLRSYDYEVKSVEVSGCLHLSTGCSFIGADTFVVNSSWIDIRPLKDFNLIHVPVDEPWAANMLTIGAVTIMTESAPESKRICEERGFRMKTLNIAEMEKAEAGLTCMSLILNSQDRHSTR